MQRRMTHRSGDDTTGGPVRLPCICGEDVVHLAHHALDFIVGRVEVRSHADPGAGSVVDYKTVQAVWKPLDVDPRSFTPGSNQEIIERVVFQDAQGRMMTLNLSYGEGEKYDRSKTAEKWRYFAARASGEEADPGEGNRIETRELAKQVVLREFLVKTIRPRAATVTGG